MENYWTNNEWVNIAKINQEFSSIQIALNACSIYPHQEDLMVWGIHPRSHFKVSFVFISKDKVNYPMWDKAWIKGRIPKINIFFWTMLQNKILTLDNLQKEGFIWSTDVVSIRWI